MTVGLGRGWAPGGACLLRQHPAPEAIQQHGELTTSCVYTRGEVALNTGVLVQITPSMPPTERVCPTNMDTR